MPSADERTITLHVTKINVVLACLNLVQAIAAEIVTQAAEQERVGPARTRPEASPPQTADGLDAGP